MKDLIVCSYATHRAGMLDEYESQLEAAGIDFHLEPVTLADGINSVTARWKFEYMRRMCEQFSDYSRIVLTDAWDVLFFGAKENLMKNLPECFTVSTERNCWPEEQIAAGIIGDSLWRFCNAGMIAGSPEKILSWLRFMTEPRVNLLGLGEQAWFNRLVAYDHFSIARDLHTEVFYTVSADKERGELQVDYKGWPWNSRYNTSPQFFHFSGKCPTEPFRETMYTGKPLCASA